MTTFIQINQQGVGVQLGLAQLTLVETPNTPELITTTGAGTWTKPEGVTKVLVECWGGGGAGGGSTINDAGGGGGGGGGYARKIITYSSPSQNISYQVGAGGTGGTGNGGNGNNTVWDTNVVIGANGTGGAAAVSIGIAGGGTGGIGNVGDVTYVGGDGNTGIAALSIDASGAGGGGAGSTEPGQLSITALGGTGGVELGGDGADGLDPNDPNLPNFTGLTGNIYGGGGSGAFKISGGPRSGGNGAQGLIRITTYTITEVTPPGVPIQMA